MGSTTVYRNNKKYFVFKDGKIINVNSPRSPVASSVIGATGEFQVARELEASGLEKIHGGIDLSFDILENTKNTQGRQGIDAMYKDANGNLVILEVKSTAGGPDVVGDLSINKDGVRQMSEAWLRVNLPKFGYNRVEVQNIIDGIGSTTRLLKAEVTNVKPGGNSPNRDIKVDYFEIVHDGDKGAVRLEEPTLP